MGRRPPLPQDRQRRSCEAAASPGLRYRLLPRCGPGGTRCPGGRRPILCDVQMVTSGVSRRRLPADNEVVCTLAEPGIADLTRQLGNTRTAASVALWRDRPEPALVAIGNAPTALFHLLGLLRDTDISPAAVLGIPVGFIGAAESKQALVDNDLGLAYIVVRGRR